MTNIDYSSLTHEQIHTLVEIYIQEITQLRTDMLAIPAEDLTWDTYIQPEISLEDRYSHVSAILTMNQVHPSADIRDACSEGEIRISQFYNTESLRRDLYEQFQSYYNGFYQREQKEGVLRDDQIRYIEDTMRSYRRSGVSLPFEERERLSALKSELSEVETTFEQNINDYEWVGHFSVSELSGMPVSWILERWVVEEDVEEEKGVRVTLQYPDYGPVLDYCKNRNVREVLWREYMQRAAESNRSHVRQMFRLRHEIASLLGYANHSDYVLEENMAKRTDHVMDFLTDLRERISPVVQQELRILSDLAQEDSIPTLQPWDIPFYTRIYKERVMGISMELVRQYFTIESVTKGVMHIYSTLFGYNFVDVTDIYKHTLWHEDVRRFEVRNSTDGSLQGDIYMDMHPREGKYGHAAMFPMISGSDRQAPIVLLVCNFPKNESLSLDDIETYLHEMGHAMHSISSRPHLSEFAGVSVPIDAVECPSQLMEEWCYQPDTLRHMANVADIPTDILTQVKCMQGLSVARQLTFCFVDMAVHGPQWDLEEYNRLVTDTYADIVGMDLPADHHFLEGWGHLVGYDAGYYGYLYSKVFATCIFEEQFKGHMLDSTVGRKFRDIVLAPGDTRDFMELLTEFLGHPPTSAAFVKSLA